LQLARLACLRSICGYASRMKIFILTLLLGLPLLTVEPVFAQSEMTVRNSIKTASGDAFLSRNYASLEAASEEYRSTKSRTPSGTWKLTSFYVGISDAMSRATGDIPENFSEVENIAVEWVAKYPNSPSAHIVQSYAWHAHGYAFRGEGSASSVSPAAWKELKKYDSLAMANLTKHQKIASVDPEWYELMLLIGRVEGWSKPQFTAMLEEALDREPLFYQTYFTALEYLLPKWGGSIAEIEEFALKAVERTSASEGKGMYARIYWYASQTQFGNRIFGRSFAGWPLMRRGFEDVIQKYPDQWNINSFAKFSCLANDEAKTKELFKLIAPGPIAQAWGSKALFDHCQQLAWR
jgi:hypothetical protein